MNVREKIRSLNLSLSDLALYLNVSRPTLYKYMEMYERKDRKQIPGDVKKVFTYISRKGTMSKEQVIVYIVNEIHRKDDSETCPVRDYMDSVEENDFKKVFIEKLVETDSFDPVLPYFSDCIDLLKGDKLTEDDVKQLAMFIVFRDKIIRNVSAVDEDVELTKRLL